MHEAWLRAYVRQGLKDLEGYLMKVIAFQRYCEQRNK